MRRREKVVRKLYDFACSCYLTTRILYSKLLIPTILTILFGTAKKSLACSLRVKVFFLIDNFLINLNGLRYGSPVQFVWYFPITLPYLLLNLTLAKKLLANDKIKAS